MVVRLRESCCQRYHVRITLDQLGPGQRLAEPFRSMFVHRDIEVVKPEERKGQGGMVYPGPRLCSRPDFAQ